MKDYSKYFGQKVSVKKEINLKNKTEYSLNDDDTIIAEIIKEFKGIASWVRVWLPDAIETMDLDNNRLNVMVEEVKDNHFEIINIYWG